jgi:predicted permease
LLSRCRRTALRSDIDEELRFHLEQRTAENAAAGMAPGAAAREARKCFGNFQSVREKCRDTKGASFGETVLQDIRFALRMMRKNPGFTAVAVLTLALGIGANTASFSLVNAILLRSLPVRNPQELRVINWQGNIHPNRPSYCRLTETQGGEKAGNVFNYPTYCEFRDRCDRLAEVFAFSEFTQLKPMAVTTRGEASVACGLMVSGNFFESLGVTLLLGQTITPDNDRAQAAPVAVISYASWQRHFGLDPKVIGETVTLNKNTFTIIGVLPQSFLGPVAGCRSDFYVPLASQPQMRPDCPLGSSDHWWVQVMARLKPGVEDQQALASLDVMFAQTAQGYFVVGSEKAPRFRMMLEDGRGGPLAPRHDLGKLLSLLTGLVLMVLLATCVNLGGLLLARGAMRQHELSVRAAVGAGRWRLTRQLLAEYLLLALAGAGLGWLLAACGKAALLRFLWPSHVTLNLQNDVRVFAFTLAVAVATAFLFGLIPAILSTRANPIVCMKARSALGAPRLGLGKVVVSIQVGLSLILLVGAGLFARTLVNLYRVETGFDTRNLLVFDLDVPAAGYQGRPLLDFYEQARTAIAALPGVQSVAHSNIRLLSGWMNNTMARVPGAADSHGSELPVLALSVSDSFLSTMGIPLLLGRDFTAMDNEAAPRVVLVNQTLARKAFPNDNPVGKFLSVSSDKYQNCQIAGVFGDIAYASLKKGTEPMVFFPYRQRADSIGTAHYEARTALDPLTLVPVIRKAVANLDSNIPLADIKTQAIQLDESIAQERCFGFLISGMALLAVLLSCIGLYGLTAYNVARRKSEIGIRMALGATPQNAAWLILREALLLAAFGVAIGVPAALTLTRFVQSQLYGVKPNDPFTIISTGMVLVAVAILAAWIPARRAAKTEPMTALRSE